MDNDLSHQAGAAVLIVAGLDWLKRANWFPWISNHTETLNRIVSIGAAVAATAGLSILSHSGDWSTGGQVTIAFPSASTALSAVMHAASQWAMTEAGHKILGNHMIGKHLIDMVTDLQGQIQKNEANK